MKWSPIGKFILVRLNLTGSKLVLGDESKYDHTGEVLAVGEAVENVAEGDTVLLNGPQGVLSHHLLGENVVLVAAPLVLAKCVDYKSGEPVEMPN